MKRSIMVFLSAMLAACLCLAPVEALAGTLAVPAKTVEIKDEAFYGDKSVTAVTLPEGLKRIGSKAFAGTGVTKVRLPASLTYIADDAFDGPDTVRITCEDESGYAYQWAVANGYIVAPTITQQPTSVKIATGRDVNNNWICDDFSFSVKAEDAVGYQWEYSEDDGEHWFEVRGETGRVYKGTPTRAALQHPYCYRCRVIGRDGSAYTKTVRMYNDSAVKILSQPVIYTQDSFVQTSDWSQFIEVTLEALNGESYQWQASDDGGKSWKNVGERTSGFLGARYYELVQAIPENRRYRCKVYGPKGDSVVSEATAPGDFYGVGFNTQPSELMAAVGDAVTFTANAYGMGIAYHWQASADGKTWTDLDRTTADTNTLTFTAAAADLTKFYRCKIYNDYNTAYSDSVRLWGLGIAGKAKITRQPQSSTTEDGVIPTLRIQVKNADHCLWQERRIGNIDEWTDLYIPQGRDQDVITAYANRMHTYEYRCVVYGDDGVAVISDVLSFPANYVANKPTVSQQPVDLIYPMSPNRKPGATGLTDFTITGQNISSYLWQVSVDNGKTWNTAKEDYSGEDSDGWVCITRFSMDPEALERTRYRCKLTGPTGLVTYSTVVRVIDAGELSLEITAPSGAAEIGEEQRFRAWARSENGAPTVQWQRSGDGGVTWRDMPGKVVDSVHSVDDAYASVTVEACVDVTPENIGTKLRCVATLEDGTTRVSDTYSVVWDPHMWPLYKPAHCYQQPTDKEANVGDTVKFELKAEDVYCWCWQSSTDGKTWKLVPGSSGYYNGPSEEKGVYTLSVKATAENIESTMYRCRLMGWGGYVCSSESVRIIGKSAYVTVQPSDQQVSAGETATFWVRSPNATAWQWQQSDDGKTWKHISGAAAKRDRYAVSATAALIGKRQYRCALTGPNGKVVYSDAAGLIGKTAGHTHDWQAIAERAFVMDKAGYEYEVDQHCNCGFPLRSLDEHIKHMDGGDDDYVLFGGQIVRGWNRYWDGEEGLREPLHAHGTNYGGPTPPYYEPMQAHFNTATIGYRCGCGMTKPE